MKKDMIDYAVGGIFAFNIVAANFYLFDTMIEKSGGLTSDWRIATGAVCTSLLGLATGALCAEGSAAIRQQDKRAP